MQVTLNQALLNAPLALRDYLKRQTMGVVEEKYKDSLSVDPREISDIMEGLRQQIGLH